MPAAMAALVNSLLSPADDCTISRWISGGSIANTSGSMLGGHTSPPWLDDEDDEDEDGSSLGRASLAAAVVVVDADSSAAAAAAAAAAG
jgi:hypothetical protein